MTPQEMFEEMESAIEPKHTEVLYNGGFNSDDDPMDFIEASQIVGGFTYE
ncbi:hypothetical protein [Abyssicoccus albus]|uniref:Uncharacterized protein n=1 Tax=Abyssicoccus albus TaxID=1817405 RepID=A0A3N5BAI1_9BACL|nr:hypothetical protein [Abyssicoccus albus]RPF54776.1 hypothetical protein EDD62_1737 [Abyssicoccus albus]